MFRNDQDFHIDFIYINIKITQCNQYPNPNE